MINHLLSFLKAFWTFFLTLFGFVFVLWFLWVRFIRERLPKEIPFSLSEIGFYFILYICVLYFYIILRIYKT